MKNRFACRAALLGMLWWAVFGSAVELGARWDNTVSLFQESLPLPTRQPHAHQRLSIHLAGGERSFLSFDATVGYAGYFDSRSTDRFDLYHALAQWENAKRTARVGIGRHYVFDLVDPAGVDGVRARMRIGRYLSVVGLAGLLSPEPESRRLFGTDPDSPAGMFGGRITLTPGARTGIGVVYQATTGSTATPIEVAGVDMYHRFGPRARLFGTAVYGLLDNTFDRYNFALDLSPSNRVDVKVGSGYQGRPAHTGLALDSLLWRPRHFVAVGCAARPTKRSTIDGEYRLHVFPAQSVGHLLRIGGSVGPLAAGYTRCIGGGGDGFGIAGDVRLVDRGRFTTRLDVDYRAYGSGAGDEWDRALSTGLAARWRPSEAFVVDARGLFLRDRYYSYDFRFLLNTTVSLGSGV